MYGVTSNRAVAGDHEANCESRRRAGTHAEISIAELLISQRFKGDLLVGLADGECTCHCSCRIDVLITCLRSRDCARTSTGQMHLAASYRTTAARGEAHSQTRRSTGAEAEVDIPELPVSQRLKGDLLLALADSECMCHRSSRIDVLIACL